MMTATKPENPKLQIIEAALENVRAKSSDPGASPVLALIENQLSYIRKALAGRRTYKIRTDRINVGTVGPLLFADRDPSLAEALVRSQEVADDLPRFR